MPLMTVILVLVAVGVGLWVLNAFVPMAKPVKKILNIVVLVLLALWLLQVFGVLDNIRGIRIN